MNLDLGSNTILAALCRYSFFCLILLFFKRIILFIIFIIHTHFMEKYWLDSFLCHPRIYKFAILHSQFFSGASFSNGECIEWHVKMSDLHFAYIQFRASSPSFLRSNVLPTFSVFSSILSISAHIVCGSWKLSCSYTPRKQ